MMTEELTPLTPEKRTQQLNEMAWVYYMQWEEELDAIALKQAGRDRLLADELMSDVVLERLPRIIELWQVNGDGRPLKPYVNNTVMLYCWKYVMIKRRKTLQELPEDYGLCASVNDPSTLEHDEEVDYLLSCLSDDERQLVYLNVVHGYSYKTLADMTGISRVKISAIVRDALERVRFNYERDRQAEEDED